MIQQHVQQAAENSPSITYTATGATVLFWGLHAGDIAVLLSALASILGVCLQFYLALSRIRRVEQGQESNAIVTHALAESHRVLDKNQKETTQ